MESRTALRGTGISRWLIALFALVVVLGLGVMAGYLANSVSAPAATHTNTTSTEAGPTGVSNDEPGAVFNGSDLGLVP